MSQTNAMNPTATGLRDEDEVNCFRKLLDIFDKTLKMAFLVVAFKTTAMGEAVFTTQPHVMIVMIFMIELYYSLRLLETMLPQHDIFKTRALRCLILLIGTISPALVLSIVSPSIAYFTTTLRVTFLALTAAYYCYHQNLHELVARAISDLINKLFDLIKKCINYV